MVSQRRPIFTVRGRVAFFDGTPARAYVAIVDADPDLDDLIAAGTTEPDGTFRASFTAEAFNQEAGEAEARPDLYVIVSVLSGTSMVPLLRRDFGKLAFANAASSANGAMEEDLGTLLLPLGRGEKPSPTPGLRSSPGRGKVGARRLRLDDDLVELAVDEVARHVEALTGWSRLRDGVRFAIMDDFDEPYRERARRLLGRSDFSPDELAWIASFARGCEADVFAQWDQVAQVVLLNRRGLELQGLDCLKVTLGHELVHVGQMRARPDLAALQELVWSRSWRHLLDGTVATVDERREDARLMANIEGYAAYIEETYLARIYTHATPVARHAAAADRRFRTWENERTLPKTPAGGSVEGPVWTKASQYVAGHAAYLRRTPVEAGPVPFDGDLRPAVEPDDLELAELLIALRERARGAS